MPLELGVIVVVVTLHGSVPDGSVHPLDLSIRPRIHRLYLPMFVAKISASRFKGVATEENTLGRHRLDVFVRPSVSSKYS